MPEIEIIFGSNYSSSLCDRLPLRVSDELYKKICNPNLSHTTKESLASVFKTSEEEHRLKYNTSFDPNKMYVFKDEDKGIICRIEMDVRTIFTSVLIHIDDKHNVDSIMFTIDIIP